MQDELPALAKCATEVEFKPGQYIIKQGEEGHEFFMIKSLASKSLNLFNLTVADI